MNEDTAALQNFSGIARLFPLPNLVFCPHAVQPLHIFEPRYRQMAADALAEDRLIAIVLLQPGWESHYDQRPAIHTMACLGRIVADQLLPDGRYNLLLRGLSRVRLIEEIPSEKLYRSARVELAADHCDVSLEAVMTLRNLLKERVMLRFGAGTIAKQVGDLFHSELSIGALCDVLSFALPIPIDWKQLMLEETSEVRRANLLLESFNLIAPPAPGKTTSTRRAFPPEFSSN
jgi:Lon protease-like protein